MYKKSISNIKFNKNVLLLPLVPLIILGKFIRYTILKTVLVDTAIGNFYLPSILQGNSGFTFFGTDRTTDASINAIFIFRIFNVFGISTYEGFEIAITILFNIILLIIISQIKKSLNWIELLFVMLSIVVLNLFDFTLSKEPIQMLYFIAIYLILISERISIKNKNILVVDMLILSVATFRVYYILVVIFMIFCQVLCTKLVIKNKNYNYKTFIGIIVCIGIFYFIFLNVCKYNSYNSYLELIRVRTRVSTAASDMHNIFPNNNLAIFTLDYFLMIVRMLLPVELLKLGIKYFPYVFYQIMMTYYLLHALKSLKTNSQERNLALFVYLGFLFASATFEPDFGSWVRHEAVTLPVFFVLADM